MLGKRCGGPLRAVAAGETVMGREGEWALQPCVQCRLVPIMMEQLGKPRDAGQESVRAQALKVDRPGGKLRAALYCLCTGL